MLGRRASALLVLAVAVAGCSGEAPDAGADATDAPDASPEQAAQSGIGLAPEWKVGQSWDHHWYFGPDDSVGFNVKAIVVSAGPDGYRVATDEPIDAASHASFYFHDQGVMSTTDWTIGDFDGAFRFPWYDFPLADGKSWTAREENLDFNLVRVSRDLSMTATAVDGTPGAFSIEAREGSGGLRARYDYQPAIGWFSDYKAYDPQGDPEAYTVRMVNEGQAQGWSGTYYTAKGDFLLDALSVVSPAGGTATAQPPQTFTVTEAHTQVMAIPFVFAAAGASAAELVAPDGQHWDAYTVRDPDGAPVSEGLPGLVFVPAVAGDWRFATAGAGAFVAGGGCFAWGITMAEGTL